MSQSTIHDERSRDRKKVVATTECYKIDTCVLEIWFFFWKNYLQKQRDFFFLESVAQSYSNQDKSFMAVEGCYLQATSINSTHKIILSTRRTAEIARKRQANRPYVLSTMTTRISDCQDLFAFDYYVLPYPLCSPHNRKVLLLFFSLKNILVNKKLNLKIT